MTEKEFQTFADNYTSADFDRVRYDWNGKYGGDFQDNNYDFRMKLCQFLLPQIKTVKSELIRDLFSETAKTSEATFSAYINLHVYAQELLTRDWKKYLMDYMEAGTYGMDAYGMIGRIEIPKSTALEIFTFMKKTIETTSNEREKSLMTGYLPRFEWLSNKS